MESHELIEAKLAQLPEIIEGKFQRRFAAVANSSVTSEYPYILQYSSDHMHVSEQEALTSENVLIWIGGETFEEVFEKTKLEIKK